MSDDERIVGITSTIPIEVLFAAGRAPLDLNNVFITSDNPESYVRLAEAEGFPANVCAWIKGIYGAIKKHQITEVVGVVGGECSSTHALFEILTTLGLTIHRFSYPYDRDPGALEGEIKKLCGDFKTSMAEAEVVKARLDAIRERTREIDELTYRDNTLSGSENHLWLIQTSDLLSDFELYERRAAEFIARAREREPFGESLRLGYVGIPPICSDIYDQVERRGARVVFNEFQRQFSMPHETKSLVEQYRRYTYPYDVFFRIDDIRREIERRRLDGLIHYVQSFCFRGIQDRLLRESMDIPILTMEFDRPGPMDAHSITRLEAFIEMMKSGK
jgi:benzoyl-CoA reductase/2-hydroxyglutaryl-CoA dehydratase subunit BcrC/BadD/HgdB